MLLQLEPRPKTLPSNYAVAGFSTGDLGEPGYTLTPEAMARAQRKESEYFDWRTYEEVTQPQVEHPEYRSKGEAAALAAHWERIVSEREPLPRGA